jgi:hypothetical protein
MTPLIASSTLLAHQGGWDEILLVAGPIAVVVGLLAVVRRRVNARLADPADESDVLEPRADR